MTHRSLCFAVLLVASGACGDFSPKVGAALRLCATTDASTSADAASGAYGATGGYGATLTPLPACADAGPTNTLQPDAGVTGNVVIADQLNNRVLVLDRQGNVAWSFGNGSSAPGAASVVAPNDVEYLPTKEVLITGTGAPPGGEPTCPADGGGCIDDRILIVDAATKHIVWTFGGHAGGPGSGTLSAPASATLVAKASGDHVLISDQGNGRVLEVDRDTDAVVWQYPFPGDTNEMIGPQNAQRLPTGNTLIVDQSGNRVLEVTSEGHVAWQYPEVVNPAALDFPSFASRLPDGNTLIADSNNDRVLEVDPGRNIVWSYETASLMPAGNASPTCAVRLANGHTLVTEILEDQIVEVDHATPPNVLYTQGQRGVPGSLAGELNQPYVANVVGDFTGLTAPELDAGP